MNESNDRVTELQSINTAKEIEIQFLRDVSKNYHSQLQLREGRVLDAEKRVEANAQKILETMTKLAETMAAILSKVESFASYKEAVGDMGMSRTKVEVENV